MRPKKLFLVIKITLMPHWLPLGQDPMEIADSRGNLMTLDSTTTVYHQLRSQKSTNKIDSRRSKTRRSSRVTIVPQEHPSLDQFIYGPDEQKTSAQNFHSNKTQETIRNRFLRNRRFAYRHFHIVNFNGFCPHPLFINIQQPPEALT